MTRRSRRRRGDEDESLSDLEDSTNRGSDRDTDTSDDDSGNDREENGDNVQIGAPPIPPPLPAAQQQGVQQQQQLGGQAQGELLQTRVRPVIPGPERIMGMLRWMQMVGLRLIVWGPGIVCW